MKRLILAGLVTLGTVFAIQATAPQATAHHIDCSLVRCQACPAGYVFAPTPHDCCRCVPA
jgi:hypothetical protein